MDVKLYYVNGKIHRFSPYLFTTGEPFKEEGSGKDSGMPRNNVMTEFVFRGDLLLAKGLVLEVFWYNTVIDKQTTAFYDASIDHKIFHASRELGRLVTVASLDELRDVERIEIDGELIALRSNDQLINMSKFAQQELLYSDCSSSASLATRLMALYQYKKGVHPSLGDEAIASELGFPIEVFEHLRACETCQDRMDDAIDRSEPPEVPILGIEEAPEEPLSESPDSDPSIDRERLGVREKAEEAKSFLFGRFG